MREGVAQLLDEETVVMHGGPSRERVRLDLPVQPGEHAIVRISSGQSDPRRYVIWAGRGNRW